MQSNPNRISSNPLIVNPFDGSDHFKVCRKTPNGRVFHCCDNCASFGKHGRYFLPKKRWDKSKRDHGKIPLFREWWKEDWGRN